MVAFTGTSCPEPLKRLLNKGSGVRGSCLRSRWAPGAVLGQLTDAFWAQATAAGRAAIAVTPKPGWDRGGPWKKKEKKKQAASNKADAWDKNTERAPCQGRDRQRPGSGCGAEPGASSQPLRRPWEQPGASYPPPLATRRPQNRARGCRARAEPPPCSELTAPALPFLALRCPSSWGCESAALNPRAGADFWLCSWAWAPAFRRNCRERCTSRAGGGGQLPRRAEDPPRVAPSTRQ